MITVPSGVHTIEKYPFRIGNLVVDVLGKPTDWREVLRNLHVKEEFERLASHVFNLGLQGEKQIVCPIPVHGTDFTSSKELKALSVSRDQVTIYRGKEADGAVIHKGEVFALASADCLTVALYDPQVHWMLALHFSRESGVIGDILERALLCFTSTARSRMMATITLGIHPDVFLHEWDHPTHGGKNKEMTTRVRDEFGRDALSKDESFGGLNLRYIAAVKLIRNGLRASNIFTDQLDTFTDPRFWSNRASSQKHSGKFGETGRNMVLVLNQ